jgi:hypothetical protein
MTWKYRQLREDLQKLEPRKFHTVSIDEFVTKYWRGQINEQIVKDAILAVKRGVKMMGEQVEVFYQDGKIHVKILPSCSCGR